MSQGIQPVDENPPPIETKIECKPWTATPEIFFRVADVRINKLGEPYEDVRGSIVFESWDEVKRAIEVLRAVLPVVDQLGGLVDDD